jgi:hypothetical protein
MGELAGDYCRRWILAPDVAGNVRLIGRLLSNADERGFTRMFADRAFSRIAISLAPVLSLYPRHSVIIRAHPRSKSKR